MYEAAALKLDRSREHIEAARVEVAAWLESDALTIERTTDDSTGRTEARVRLRQPPPVRLSAILGDAVHNLRAALDHAVYGAAAAHADGALAPKIEGELMFPVIGPGGKTTFDNAAARRLVGVPDAVRAAIENEQPFHCCTEVEPLR
jgi:hypothetical protein